MTHPVTFRPLGKYDWPSSPVNRGLDTVLSQIKKKLRPANKEAGIDPETLTPASDEVLSRIAEPPAHVPLMAELNETLTNWVTHAPTPDRVRTFVLPPCDRENLLGQWAKANELQVFGIDRSLVELDTLDKVGATPLVIPKLERRFLRTRDGLQDIRRLLDRLATMERRIIIGCNSWAWQFLRKSCEIDLIFADPLTFQAFGKQRLRSWLGTLALDPADGANLCFRSSTTGRDVFGNGEGETEVSAFMTDLAKRSLGVPWVAWHLWRGSLHVLENAENTTDDIDTENNQETVWVTDLRPPTLPSRSDQNALLVLHALLIHGGLTQDQIVQTVPLVSYTHVLASLQRAGLIDKTGGFYACLPSAYPAIRDALNNNGYPVDSL